MVGLCCDPDAPTWKLAVLPRAPLQNPFANSLQTSDAPSINPTKPKTHEPFLFPNAPFDKWKQDIDFDSFIGGAKRELWLDSTAVISSSDRRLAPEVKVRATGPQDIGARMRMGQKRL